MAKTFFSKTDETSCSQIREYKQQHVGTLWLDC